MNFFSNQAAQVQGFAGDPADKVNRFRIDPGKLKKGTLIGEGGFGQVFTGTYAKDPRSEPLQVCHVAAQTADANLLYHV